MPIDFTPAEIKWFDGLRLNVPFPIDRHGRTWLDGAFAARWFIARYFLEDPRYGNFSIAVRDEWQNRGVGTVLLDAIMDIARARGLAGFTVDTLLENKAMINLSRHAAKIGHYIQRMIEGSMVQYSLTFMDKEE